MGGMDGQGVQAVHPGQDPVLRRGRRRGGLGLAWRNLDVDWLCRAPWFSFLVFWFLRSAWERRSGRSVTRAAGVERTRWGAPPFCRSRASPTRVSPPCGGTRNEQGCDQAALFYGPGARASRPPTVRSGGPRSRGLGSASEPALQERPGAIRKPVLLCHGKGRDNENSGVGFPGL